MTATFKKLCSESRAVAIAIASRRTRDASRALIAMIRAWRRRAQRAQRAARAARHHARVADGHAAAVHPRRHLLSCQSASPNN